MSHTYEYPRPSLTVDAAIVAVPGSEKKQAQLLLIQRRNSPCKGMWALPGGFVDENESLDTAAARELQEETSVDPKDVTLFQVGAFGDKGRDPRGWCVTVAYAALVPADLQGVKAADDAAEAEWFPVTELPTLAFDHKLVVRTAFEKLTEHSSVAASGGDLKGQLQQAAEALQGPWYPPKE
eukprot:CAMPEP_0206150266 /NCGR_PEP_ID=MMETSP1473-20131121/38207_1 /ASSEMBLY_ACC=CAM_ASM_001109 /TAXON_ID=1461547 /ORGANISM="Stichococcus sp, Strain RCC1054" /LENGTH=180 /DNA_ID=CAMNT_0053547761 /DNA_START=102 /DNA_END=644 /DNA_ORIENTATION=+